MLRLRVGQGFSGRPSSIAAVLTQCSAMLRQVVHLPPVTVMSPVGSMWITWSRERAEVIFASPDRTRGLMPTNTLRTSARVRGWRR